MKKKGNTKELDFTTSDFPRLISEAIESYLAQEGITQKMLAQRCVLHSTTISKMKNGSYKSKSLIVILCIGMKKSLKESFELLRSAGYRLSKKNNTDIAYCYFLEHSMDMTIDECEEKITEFNKSIKSSYSIDKIKPLHRKRNKA